MQLEHIIDVIHKKTLQLLEQLMNKILHMPHFPRDAVGFSNALNTGQVVLHLNFLTLKLLRAIQWIMRKWMRVPHHPARLCIVHNHLKIVLFPYERISDADWKEMMDEMELWMHG